MPPDPAPLAGLLVADFSRVLAGPLAAMVLADLGATVVKVERPGTGDDTRSWGPPWRDGQSTYSLAANRGKRSLTLDLDDPDDRALAVRLATRADVLLENFRPGTAARFGLDHTSLAAANPRLICASVTAFGTAQQAAGIGGYDLLVQAMSGLMSITGHPDGEPTKIGVAIVDVVSGLYVAVGILAALAERQRSGRGQHVEVSLMSAALAALVNQASGYLGAGVVPGRLGNAHPSIAPYETLRAADRPLVVAVGSDRLFARLCEVLERPELAADVRFATNPARVTNRAALVVELEQALAAAPAAVWVERLRAQGVPAGPVNDLAAAVADAQRLGLSPVLDTQRADGSTVPTVRSPVVLSRTPGGARTAPPLLAEHDAELRAWLQAEDPPPLAPLDTLLPSPEDHVP